MISRDIYCNRRNDTTVVRLEQLQPSGSMPRQHVRCRSINLSMSTFQKKLAGTSDRLRYGYARSLPKKPLKNPPYPSARSL